MKYSKSRPIVFVGTPRHMTRQDRWPASVYCPEGPVCYFIGMEGLIKIGQTGNLRQRLRWWSVGPDRLLATEPGDFLREHELHEQFKHLHTGHELFRPGDDLVAYILALAA